MQGLEICCVSSLLDTINNSKRMFSILPAQLCFWRVKDVNEGRIFDPTGSCLEVANRLMWKYLIWYQLASVYFIKHKRFPIFSRQISFSNHLSSLRVGYPNCYIVEIYSYLYSFNKLNWMHLFLFLYFLIINIYLS